MDLGLQNKIVAIAGGSYGIGYATAHQLLSEGANLSLMSRNISKLENVSKHLMNDLGIQPFVINGDVKNKQDCKRFIESTVNKFGQLDGLVVAAGASQKGTLEKSDEQLWRENWDLNVMSLVFLVKTALPYLKKSTSPRIVILGSASAKQPTENQLISNVTKAGTLTFVKTLANELANDNICINNVCPGKIYSERREKRVINEAKEKGITVEEHISSITSHIPLKRLGEPKEVASLITFLLSTRASYITGQSINVDGGLVKSIF